MAEAIVQTVIGKAVEMAADQLFQMGSSLHHLQDNIRSLEMQMRNLQSYLKDAEFKKARNHQVAELIIQIRDLAQDAEDILDTYLPEFERHRTKGPFHFVKHASCILCYGATAKSFASKIKKIKERAAEVKESMVKYDIAQNANAGANDDMEVWESRKLFLQTRDSNVFGREETLQTLEEEMLSKDKQCKIISIVGPGGVGKTTVAKKVYMNAKGKFDSCAMLYVSNKPNVKELLLDISKQVGLTEEKVRENLEDNLRLFLQERTYLIYLDDIWEQEPWDLLRNVLVSNSNKDSRILVTSRNIDVCRYIESGKKSTLVSLKALNKYEENEFFNYLMSPTTEEAPLPQIFKDIGAEIMGKCGGLPLAIEVAVGMLRAKGRSVDAWRRVLESMPESAEDRCQKMLALSYEDLPTDIKPLFLYFGIFPEDYEVFVSDLIRLWVAEKLIKIDGPRKPEKIVEDKIENLIARNLIQVSRRGVDGRIRSCRIHDLLHNLCVRVARDCNFFCTWDNLQSSDFVSSVRRLTSNFSTSSQHYNFQNQSRVPGKLRALINFSKDKQVLMFIQTSASHLKFLRFLIIEISFDERVYLPDEIGNLSSLICLRLSGNFRKIPSSLCGLKKLEMLEVSGESRTTTFPASILRTKHLKHLLLKTIFIETSSLESSFPRTEVEIDLPSLETASLFRVQNLNLIVNSLKKLSNLVKLFIVTDDDETCKVVSDGASVLKMKSLKLHLNLHFTLGLNLSRYQSLVKLRLVFYSSSCAYLANYNLPPNLVEISLSHARMFDGDMERLKRLERLEILKLNNCHIGDTNYILNFSGENSFPHFKF